MIQTGRAVAGENTPSGSKRFFSRRKRNALQPYAESICS
jgi:hypothetical protein